MRKQHRPHSWIGAGQRWLRHKATMAFDSWLTTSDGKKWRRRKRKVSPYRCGFQLPQWHHDAIAAIGSGDERGFKAIKVWNI